MIPIINLALIIMMFGFIIVFFLIGWRWMIKIMVKKTGKIIFSDSYQENIIEMIPGFRHMGIQKSLENNLRAESGDVLHRPLGSTINWPHLDTLTFIPAQISLFPTDGDEDIDVKVTIGPKAKKPLELDIPLMISGMAYGIALSEEARLALAEISKKTGTAINSGEGGVMQEEVDTAEKYILQFAKTDWAKEEKLLKRADMIEIKFGQGAYSGVGGRISPENLTGKARKVMGLEEGETAVIYDHFFENQTWNDLKDLVSELRRISGGVPIGAKLGAGGKLEEDIDSLIDLGVDYIAVDGGQAATHSSPPVLSDDFGIPTLHAVVRASNHLEKRKKKGEISLIVSGGLFTPGQFLKVLALGADAVYMGSAMLFAISHSQVFKAIPFEPPTQIVWNEGKFKNKFNREEGVRSGSNFITASIEEMKMGIRAMGKRSLKEVSKKDLVSYDELTAKMVGVPFTFEPYPNEQENQKNQGSKQGEEQKGKQREGTQQESQLASEQGGKEASQQRTMQGNQNVTQQDEQTVSEGQSNSVIRMKNQQDNGGQGQTKNTKENEKQQKEKRRRKVRKVRKLTNSQTNKD
ncbi:FMN-binding glutamate synthase family protein [Oceanobacillus halophilus]|uniref:FMN-binding glutamate synthase family protein n=1 Tax=Oceanobacillus halophilus TaxID=930130 RepID=A0A495A4Z7_9BACI|nr:FMN-binding glutamate synthase family protein [Oceanobacillus halophilus]